MSYVEECARLLQEVDVKYLELINTSGDKSDAEDEFRVAMAKYNNFKSANK